MKGNPYREFGGERAHWAFLESRGIMPEAHPRFKLSRNTTALFEAALRLAEGSTGTDLWIPYADVGQELLDAGLVARTTHADGRITYRLTPAGEGLEGSMNLRPIISDAGAWSFDPEDLARCGYQSTGRRLPDDSVGLGMVQVLAKELDVTMASLQAFRTGPIGSDVEWEYFYTPDRKPGFCGSPLLPPGTW